MTPNELFTDIESRLDVIRHEVKSILQSLASYQDVSDIYRPSHQNVFDIFQPLGLKYALDDLETCLCRVLDEISFVHESRIRRPTMQSERRCNG